MIIDEVIIGAIDVDYTWCHGHYIIRFSSYSYNLKDDFNIYVGLISSSKMVYEGTYPPTTNSNSHYYVYLNHGIYNRIYRWGEISMEIFM